MLDYATADSEVRRVLEERIAQMESKAAKLQVGRLQGRQAGQLALAVCWGEAVQSLGALLSAALAAFEQCLPD